MVPYPDFMAIYHLLLFIFFKEPRNITNKFSPIHFFFHCPLPWFNAHISFIVIYIFLGTRQDMLPEHSWQCAVGLVLYLYFHGTQRYRQHIFLILWSPTPVLCPCIIYCCLYFSFKPEISKTHFCFTVPYPGFMAIYTLLQKKCTLISSSSPGDPGSLTPTPGQVKFVTWSWE